MTMNWKAVLLFILILIVCLILVVIFHIWGVLALVLLSAIYGWVVFAFFHYRYVRQEEFLHLLTTAAETEAPLAPALWAYVNDRPHSELREFWTAMLLLFVLPGYYWMWHRRHG